MAAEWIRSFVRDESAAIAATYALLLVPIVGLAGVAYDFAQMASLDTEVQNAADQAALAAATQLSGKEDAIAQATSAASNLVLNKTVMAAEVGSNDLTVSAIEFYNSRSDAEADQNSFTNAALSASAKFVKVTIAARHAKFALTPIVGLIMSNDLGAAATAGLGEAICKVPPIMMCNPDESDANFDGPSGDPNYYVGRGLRLVSVTDSGAGSSWAAGNFGYIDVTGGNGGNALLALKKALGWNVPPGECLPQSGVSTETGANTPVTHALNTRFDIYENGGPGGSACPTGGDCSPSVNTVKDLVRDSTASASQCGTGSNAWHEPVSPYLPDATTRQQPAATPITGMGHPRDVCHSISSSGDCASVSGNDKIGDGFWDRSRYFAVNYPGLTSWRSLLASEYPSLSARGNDAFGDPKVTRYEVYKWEIKNRNVTFPGMSTTLGGMRIAEAAGGGGAKETRDYNAPFCQAPGIVPTSSTIDRRTFPVAVVNCQANNVKGNSTGVPVVKWVNVFLVEPSVNRTRTQQQDVYVEVVSVNSLGNSDGGGAAVVQRNKPYLLK